MKLTEVLIRTAKPGPKQIRMFDGEGLYLAISPSGNKSWRMKYYFPPRVEKLLTLGPYPEITLKTARDLRFQAKQKLALGIDPGQAKKAEKAGMTGEDSFEAIAREYLKAFGINRTESYNARVLTRLEHDVFPWLGKRPIKEITAQDLRGVIQRVRNRDALETSRRILQSCGQVFRYAISTGRAEHDLSQYLRGAFPRHKAKHRAAITEPRAVGELLRAIDGYQSPSIVVKSALRLLPLVFLRSQELRLAEWSEIDYERREWRIPASRMKMKAPHIVPLSRQAIDILRDLEPITNRPLEGRPDAPRYIFTGGHSRARPMSENGILTALRRMGYTTEEMCGHGFRTIASTLMHEQNWNHHAIERQLAHKEPNQVVAAYNHSEYLDQRRKMMQDWANYLDELKAVTKAVPLFKVA
jgi:integrase